MIILKNMREVKSYVGTPSTSVYAIVRKMTYPIDGVEQLKTLATTTSLFHWYVQQRRAGLWSYEAFVDTYVPRFLESLANDASAHELMLDLAKRANYGERIVLACYCDVEALCHRSIIGGILDGMGADVKTRIGNDYRMYYSIYMKLKGGCKHV